MELLYFSYATRVAREDNVNPLLLPVLLKDLFSMIRNRQSLIKVTFYADHLVIYGCNRFQM